MSCSECSDMVRVWKKRSKEKKNGKISREGEGKGQWKEEKESIDIERSNDNCEMK